MVYCHNCGTKNDDDAEFCSKCGEPLKDVSDYEGAKGLRNKLMETKNIQEAEKILSKALAL